MKKGFLSVRTLWLSVFVWCVDAFDYLTDGWMGIFKYSFLLLLFVFNKIFFGRLIKTPDKIYLRNSRDSLSNEMPVRTTSTPILITEPYVLPKILIFLYVALPLHRFTSFCVAFIRFYYKYIQGGTFLFVYSVLRNINAIE